MLRPPPTPKSSAVCGPRQWTPPGQRGPYGAAAARVRGVAGVFAGRGGGDGAADDGVAHGRAHRPFLVGHEGVVANGTRRRRLRALGRRRACVCLPRRLDAAERRRLGLLFLLRGLLQIDRFVRGLPRGHVPAARALRGQAPPGPPKILSQFGIPRRATRQGRRARRRGPAGGPDHRRGAPAARRKRGGAANVAARRRCRREHRLPRILLEDWGTILCQGDGEAAREPAHAKGEAISFL